MIHEYIIAIYYKALKLEDKFERKTTKIVIRVYLNEKDDTLAIALATDKWKELHEADKLVDKTILDYGEVNEAICLAGRL